MRGRFDPIARIAAFGRGSWEFVRRHHGTLLLLAILGIAALPRLWALTDVGLRGDEAVYAGQAGVLAGDDGLHRYFVLASRGNSNFLFYQEIVALVYLIFGVSDMAARFVSVGFSLATVLVVYELGRTLYTRNVGLLSAAFMALSGYGVLLGRLALLDTTLVFLFSLSMMFFAKWLMTGRDRWLYAFAAALAWTIQAKVTGGLVLIIAVNYLLVSRQLHLLSVRKVLRASLAFTVFFIPVLVQLALKGHQLLEFLSDSGDRVAHVPWYYYLDKLTSFEGFVTPLIWLAGLAIALARWRTGDRLLVFWVVVVALFFQFYPLKAFNYALPLIPAVSILAGLAVHEGAVALASWWRRPRRRSRRIVARGIGETGAIVLGCLIFASTAKPVYDAAKSDSYFGLREAAMWLKDNTSPNAGVMTLSKGSAQYALSFYARRDAYPYGRFRLATIVPGGKVLNPSAAADGGPSTDWVSHWPPRLIKSREVSYLVYYTDEGDDPPENPLVDNAHQERFRRFIEAYGGKLMHVVYRNHEGRAWIYKVQKLERRAKIKFRTSAKHLQVSGTGFRFKARVTLYYHGAKRGVFKTDRDGAFTHRIRLPYYVQASYYLVATDNFGNYASTVGLRPSVRNRRARRRIAQRVRREKGRDPRSRRAEGPPGRSPLKVELDMPKQTPVGDALPVKVHIKVRDGARLVPSPQSHLFFQIYSKDGKTPVRWRERVTNTLGTAYLQLAALELPGFYQLSLYASKGGHRGQVTRTFKVRRR